MLTDKLDTYLESRPDARPRGPRGPIDRAATAARNRESFDAGEQEARQSTAAELRTLADNIEHGQASWMLVALAIRLVQTARGLA